MSVSYRLVNFSKEQIISFAHLPVSTKNEICGHFVSAKIVSLYMLDNIGDEISFVSDQCDEINWKLSVPTASVNSYQDVTEVYLCKAESIGIIKGRRKDILDNDEPHVFLWRFDCDGSDL